MVAVDAYGAVNAMEDYAGWDHEKHRADAIDNMSKYEGRGRLIEGISWEVANQFDDGSVDFVFIDGDHSYEGCRKDIDAWLPKIRAGGFISGHDYSWPTVKDAIADTIGAVELRPDDCWYKTA
jgi:predicted O-methyltransferase YrrM